jgi:hypothetical protein
MLSEEYVAFYPHAVVGVVVRIRAGRPWNLGLIACKEKKLASSPKIPYWNA